MNVNLIVFNGFQRDIISDITYQIPKSINLRLNSRYCTFRQISLFHIHRLFPRLSRIYRNRSLTISINELKAGLQSRSSYCNITILNLAIKVLIC